MSDEKQPSLPAKSLPNEPDSRATHLLDREAPDEYRQEWTNRLAAPAQTLSRATASLVIFRLGDEWLALPATVFQEVTEPAPIHTVPHRRNAALLGLVNVHGELLLCVALSRVLGIEKAVEQPNSGYTIYPRLLVVNKKGNRLAFLVDEVSGVYRYAPYELQEVPATLAKSSSAYVAAMLPWQDKTVGFVDDEALFLALNGSFA